MRFQSCMRRLPDEESQKQRENYITQLVEKAPGNLVPRLNLTDILIRNGEFDKAIDKWKLLHKQFPEFPKEAVEYFNKTLVLTEKKG